MKPKIILPEAFRDLFKSARYKIYEGGRGSAKSESVGRYLLIKGSENPETILCTREYQASIKDSVHSLLDYLIHFHGLQSFYKVANTEITGNNGTKFIFAGLRRNIENIKSIPNVKRCWVEEAETVSNYSWQTLIPTIRAEDSEIIVTYNPLLATSATHKRFVIHIPKDSIHRHVTYRDNPFFPDVLEKDRQECLIKDPIAYRNIWEGECRATVEGAVFADEIQKAEIEKRLTMVPYDRSVPVNTYWDLGKQAMTAIWFAQYVGQQWRILHHYKEHNKDIPHFTKYVQMLPYVYGKHYLPHDADHERLGMKDSITAQIKTDLKSIEVVPRVQKKITAIDAAKKIFSQCWFNMEGDMNCEDGVNDLRLYAYKMDEEENTISRNPVETGYERDTADAFMTFAMAAKPPAKPKLPHEKRSIYIGHEFV